MLNYQKKQKMVLIYLCDLGVSAVKYSLETFQHES